MAIDLAISSFLLCPSPTATCALTHSVGRLSLHNPSQPIPTHLNPSGQRAQPVPTHHAHIPSQPNTRQEICRLVWHFLGRCWQTGWQQLCTESAPDSNTVYILWQPSAWLRFALFTTISDGLQLPQSGAYSKYVLLEETGDKLTDSHWKRGFHRY